MKNIKTFEGFFDFAKVKKSEIKNYGSGGEGGVNAPLMPKYTERKITSKNVDDVYCFFTRELLERKKSKKLKSYAHDSYQFTYSTPERLKELKEAYPVGGKYNGETITLTCTLNSKHIGE